MKTELGRKEAERTPDKPRVPTERRELPDLGTPMPVGKGISEIPIHERVGKDDDESIWNTSGIEREEEVPRFASISPLSSIPNITDPVADSAWRGASLPRLAISPDMLVWETSERYAAWLTACHIKLGVAGVESQTFF